MVQIWIDVFEGTGPSSGDRDAGADDLDGGLGTDSVYYSRATTGLTLNTVIGGPGDDTLIGGNGIDTLLGGLGNDTLNGRGGADRLFGNDGMDTINGGGGNDTIVSGDGGGSLNGGTGNDTILAGSGAETINGGTGVDRVVYSTAASGVELDMSTGGTVGDAMGDTYIDVETIYGSLFDDVIIGDSDDNLLFGQAGNDDLDGGAGNDRLIGGNGMDELNGGGGNDSLFGGSGADIFSFSGMSTGSDRIIDWLDGTDMIDLTDWGTVANFENLTIAQVGIHVEITETGGGAGTILVYTATAGDFSVDDFIFPAYEPASSFSLEDDFGDLYAAAEEGDALFSEMPAEMAAHYEAKALSSEMADYNDFFMDALL